MRNKKIIPCVLLSVLPSVSYASFIETTMGTAVVNDATAAYFNPASLIQLKNTQIIPLGTIARFDTNFNGQTTAVSNGLIESGTSSSVSYYYSPSIYFGMPINDKITIGLAAVTNLINRDPEGNSVLRYVQSSNTIQDYDVVPSFGIKVNDYLALGAGVNFSDVDFQSNPIVGFPGTNIPDSQSNNNTTGGGIGANAGFLLRPALGTLIGFNYRTTTSYNENGTSIYNGATRIVSSNYHFKLRTPPRSIFSVSQSVTKEIGIITTIQRLQWSLIRNTHVYDIATPTGIIDATIPYYLHDTWILTLGGNYQFTPNWIVRLAGTYNQSPSHGYYQVTTGDSYTLGTSLGYKVNKTFTIDGGYAHAFIQNQSININGNRFLINGDNQASRDVVSLKVTVNV